MYSFVAILVWSHLSGDDIRRIETKMLRKLMTAISELVIFLIVCESMLFIIFMAGWAAVNACTMGIDTLAR